MLFPLIAIQVSSSGTLSADLIAQVRAFKMGAYFKPSLDRIERGDAFALAELWLNTEGSPTHDFKFESNWDHPLGQQDFRKKVLATLEQRRATDPGPACYYLAELGFLWRDRYGLHEAKAEDDYAALLEESSKYGYAWADFQIFKHLDDGDGGNPYVNALHHRRGDRALGAERRELWEQWRRRAAEHLLPLAQKGDVKAEQALLTLAEGFCVPFYKDSDYKSPIRLDALYKREQVLGWMDDAARRGSLEARSTLLWLRWDEKHPSPQQPPAEGSPEFKEIESLAELNHYPSIVYLVHYYKEQKDWAKAKAWATKGKAALGQTNESLEEAWEDVNPPEPEVELEKY